MWCWLQEGKQLLVKEPKARIGTWCAEAAGRSTTSECGAAGLRFSPNSRNWDDGVIMSVDGLSGEWLSETRL